MEGEEQPNQGNQFHWAHTKPIRQELEAMA